MSPIHLRVHSEMELLFLLLLLINFSHAQYPDLALVEAVEAAFIKKDTLLQLLCTFYPPNRLQPNHVQLRTVWNLQPTRRPDSGGSTAPSVFKMATKLATKLAISVLLAVNKITSIIHTHMTTTLLMKFMDCPCAVRH